MNWGIDRENAFEMDRQKMIYQCIEQRKLFSHEFEYYF